MSNDFYMLFYSILFFFIIIIVVHSGWSIIIYFLLRCHFGLRHTHDSFSFERILTTWISSLFPFSSQYKYYFVFLSTHAPFIVVYFTPFHTLDLFHLTISNVVAVVVHEKFIRYASHITKSNSHSRTHTITNPLTSIHAGRVHNRKQKIMHTYHKSINTHIDLHRHVGTRAHRNQSLAIGNIFRNDPFVVMPLAHFAHTM